MNKALWAGALAMAALAAGAHGLEEVDKPFRGAGGLPVIPYRAAGISTTGFALQADVPLDEQLADWAVRSGWTFRWYPEVTWQVIAPSAFGPDFERAFSDVMDILINAEGKPLRFAVSRGNRVVEVFSNDLR